MIAGAKVALSMLMGCVIGWGVLGPFAVSQEWVLKNEDTDNWQESETGWVLWISLSVMVGESTSSLFVILMRSLLKLQSATNKKGDDASFGAANKGMLDGIEALTESPHTEMSGFRKDLDEPLLPEPISSDDLNHGINGVDDKKRRRNDGDDDDIPTAIWTVGLAASCILCIFTFSAVHKLDILWFEAAMALLFALLISVLSVRALGETDFNPVSGVGKVTQIFFALISRGNVVGNLVAGAMSESAAAQCGDMMQSFKTGYLLGASPRLQFYGVLIGTFCGIFFSVISYFLFISVYPDIPNDQFSVPAAELWLNMAQLLNGGKLATNVMPFCIGGACFGALLSVLRDAICIGKYESMSNYVPSGVALAIGMYITPNYVLPRVIGGCFQFLWLRKNPDSYHRFMIVTASGFVLGEGVFAIVCALMKALNAPCCFVE